MSYAVGILIFDEVEVLDFAGPFEVFSVTTIDEEGNKGFSVSTVAQKTGIVSARNGLKVMAEKTMDQIETLDILIVPGGYGAEKVEIHNNLLLQWITHITAKTKITASVCTGALLLARAGLLEGLKATTLWMDIDEFEKNNPNISVVRNVSFVDNGHMVTSAGISAGIVMSLHIVNRIYGKDVALKTARRMEYEIKVEEL